MVCSPGPNLVTSTKVLDTLTGSSLTKALGPVPTFGQVSPSIEYVICIAFNPSVKALALSVTIQLRVKKKLLTVTKKSLSMGAAVPELCSAKKNWQTF